MTCYIFGTLKSGIVGTVEERKSYKLEIYTEARALEIFNELFPKPNLKTMETEWTL
tara:strand:+ start:67 stop:234 length:168 start_codon:yes stop_codon:yes gene_type:complete